MGYTESNISINYYCFEVKRTRHTRILPSSTLVLLTFNTARVLDLGPLYSCRQNSWMSIQNLPHPWRISSGAPVCQKTDRTGFHQHPWSYLGPHSQQPECLHYQSIVLDCQCTIHTHQVSSYFIYWQEKSYSVYCILIYIFYSWYQCNIT